MNRKNGSKPIFKVGDWVSFPYGTRIAVARVIEDRGNIGVRGRRLLRIELAHSEGEPSRFEMPEEELSEAIAPQK
jgi:hypothetical protein